MDDQHLSEALQERLRTWLAEAPPDDLHEQNLADPLGGSDVYASPMVVGEHLWVGSDLGVTAVLGLEPPFELLHTNVIGRARATPVVRGARAWRFEKNESSSCAFVDATDNTTGCAAG